MNVEIAGRSAGSGSDEKALDASAEYQRATGEAIETTLDIESWLPADRYIQTIGRLQQEIDASLADAAATNAAIREQILPALKGRKGAPSCGGHFKTDIAALREVHRNVLFNGLVCAVDGTSVVFQTLPLTIVQVGVAAVNYMGDNGTWGHRVYRRDVKLQGDDAITQALAALESQAKRDESGEHMSDMLRRAMMTYGERVVLADKTDKPWRLGHGNPLPKELLTGSGFPEVITMSVPVLRRLLLENEQVVFVPSSTGNRLLRTVGDALLPLEYAIVTDFADYLHGIIEEGHYGEKKFGEAKAQLDVLYGDIKNELVMGAFRVSPHSPAQVFFAHRNRAHEAAHIAMADSLLVDFRGFPMLLDIADHICSGMFPSDVLMRPASAAYAMGARPTQYQSERATRDR
jgi:hypothetical protein